MKKIAVFSKNNYNRSINKLNDSKLKFIKQILGKDYDIINSYTEVFDGVPIDFICKEYDIPMIPSEWIELKEVKDHCIKISNDEDKNIKKAYRNTKTNECIIEYKDGSRSSSKCAKEDSFDKYVGVALALAYREFGSKKDFKSFVDSIYYENEKTKKVNKAKKVSKTKKGTK